MYLSAARVSDGRSWSTSHITESAGLQTLSCLWHLLRGRAWCTSYKEAKAMKREILQPSAPKASDFLPEWVSWWWHSTWARYARRVKKTHEQLILCLTWVVQVLGDSSGSTERPTLEPTMRIERTNKWLGRRKSARSPKVRTTWIWRAPHRTPRAHFDAHTGAQRGNLTHPVKQPTGKKSSNCPLVRSTEVSVKQ